MRYAIALTLLILGLGLPSDAAAQTTDYYEAVVSYRVLPGGTTSIRVLCPPGYVPLSPIHPNPTESDVAFKSVPIDANGMLLPIANLQDLRGYLFVVASGESTVYEGKAIIQCVRKLPLDFLPPLISTLDPGQTRVIAGNCPTGRTVIGFVTNVGPNDLRERFRIPLFPVGATLVPLNNMPPGVYPAPARTDIGIINETSAPVTLEAATICANLPNAQMHVVDAQVIAGEPWVAFGGVPDGFDHVASFFAVSASGKNDVTVWGKEGELSAYLRALEDDSVTRNLTPKAVYFSGVGTPPSSSAKQQVVGRAILGLLLVPSATPVPPPTIVAIVEFYHDGLDHYFITAIPKEIADLDSGVHQGWRRTGETFNAYGVGSSGRTGRRPVCRVYGNPDAGLDSHFYSASPQECVATLDNFGDDWLFEAGEVFEMELPDPVSGACASDRVPIYRLWNTRSDSSHRFVKSLALRAQMIARGFMSEGYGADGVVFCALP